MKKSLLGLFGLVLVSACIAPVPGASAEAVSDSGQKQFPIGLCGTATGINLQSGCPERIPSTSADFCIKNGKFICLNGAKINRVPTQASTNALKQALSPENLKDAIEANTGVVYTIISPRGYFGVVMLKSCDPSINRYQGVAISASLDNIIKQQAVETPQKERTEPVKSTGMDSMPLGGMDSMPLGGMDSMSSGSMDTIHTGGMDTISTGKMDTISLGNKTSAGGKNHGVKNRPSSSRRTVAYRAKRSSHKRGSGRGNNSMNAFYARMNMQRFFQSSTFNTWGGGIIRTLVP
ncbi:MAG TPA: hypothetical protein VHR86_02930 [Armatimonadota bacterium]|nr:hypothetical protein [Armatimonadota bacterium]